MLDYDKTCAILKALSHPDRLKIVISLYHDECNVSECQKKMNLPQSTISQHLRIIKEAGITERIRKGTMICYKVINEFVIEVIKMLER